MPSSAPPYLPSPEEIRQRAAAIRRTWSHAEMRQRAGLSREPTPFELPSVSADFLRQVRSGNRDRPDA